MKFESINYKKIEIDQLKKILVAPNTIIPSNKVFKNLLKKLELAVTQGDYLTSIAVLQVTLYYNPEETFFFIKKKGIFRYSRYINKKCIVKDLASMAIDICEENKKLSKEIKSYLSSIILYSDVLDAYNFHYKEIIKEFRRFEIKYSDKSFIKTLLSFTDYLFLSSSCLKEEANFCEIIQRPKEDISNAVSFLIHSYTSIRNIDKLDTKFVAEDYIKNYEIVKIIELACYYSDFKEFEIMIDCFDYRCILIDKSLHIEPPYEEFEKSIRAGYIKTVIQSNNNVQKTLNQINSQQQGISLRDVIERISKVENFDIFKFKTTSNYSRYVLEMPIEVYDIIIEHFIKPNYLFDEELIYLSLIYKEQLLNYNDLEKIQIKENLTLNEFLKIRRIFVFFYIIFSEKLIETEKSDTILLYRSLIPVYTSDQLYTLLEKLFTTDKIDSFLDVVCWEPDSDFIFDLQYHPIIFVNKYFLISYSIMSNSNVIRNLYASEYKQSNIKLLNTGEILVTKLKDTFDSINIPVYTEINIGFSDIDVCAIYENTLFIFECKHSLHPVSSYDLRTTYDYLRKAESQLEKIKESYEKGKLLKILENKMNISLSDIDTMVSCIVLSNRIFNGNSFKFPVRNINEINNMLTTGLMGTDKGQFKMWNSETLTKDFMLDYFSLNNKMTTLVMDSLSKETKSYGIDKFKVSFDFYYLDTEEFIAKINEYTENFEVFEVK